jgi:hypothetical protein
MNSDLEKLRKKFSWLLRTSSFGFNKDAEGFIEIDELIDTYNLKKRNELYNDAYYCRYVWKPHDRTSYAKFNSIDNLVRNKFVLPTQYITKEQFDQLFDDFCSKNQQYFLQYSDCENVVKYFPDQFMVDSYGKKIRAIRSNESKK